DIGTDPLDCGKLHKECQPGNWCFDGVCTSFNLGTNTRGCQHDEDCPLLAPCVEGICRPLIIGTDSYNCGSKGTNCTAGELCLGGDCRRLNLTSTESNNCGSSQKPCDSGEVCFENQCLPLHIGLDPTECGDHGQVCNKSQICVTGVCVNDLV